MSRQRLVLVSLTGHAALVAGLYVTSSWRMERLDYEHRTQLTLGMVIPAAAESGALAGAKVDLTPKPQPPPKRVAETRQPRPPRPEPPPTAAATGPAEGAPGDGGAGAGPGGGDGPPELGACAAEAGCAGTAPPPLPPPPVPPPPPPAPRSVAPQILRGMRISGETAVHPPPAVRRQMVDDGLRRAVATLEVCVSAAGAVSRVTLRRSTGYPAYDDAFLAAARRWVYRPYTANGTPVPVCGAVTFQYSME